MNDNYSKTFPPLKNCYDSSHNGLLPKLFTIEQIIKEKISGKFNFVVNLNKQLRLSPNEDVSIPCGSKIEILDNGSEHTVNIKHKINGHIHLAMKDDSNDIMSAFAAGESYFDFQKGTGLISLTSRSGSFRATGEEHKKQACNAFREKYGSLKGVTYIEFNNKEKSSVTVLDE